MRAPVGGLFRHVLDLASEQTARGHAVGIVADARASDDLSTARLSAIASRLELGLELIPMSRKPGLGDLVAAHKVARHARGLALDVLHGHGAKGGAYARLAGRLLRMTGERPVAVFYTPHGGTLNFPAGSLEGRLYHRLEKVFAGLTSGLIFESEFARRTFAERIGMLPIAQRVVPNGLQPADFTPHQPNPDAADFVFIGELRDLKGVDVLLRALRIMNDRRPTSSVMVGSGPHGEGFRALTRELNLTDRVTYPGAMPAAASFQLGRTLVVPSLKESFPYIVLEGAAAGIPMVATNVGGIPEIVADTDVELVPPGDETALAVAMQETVLERDRAEARAARLRNAVQNRFTVARMTEDILEFYAKAPALTLRLPQSIGTKMESARRA
jgi:glycosyltransferase involved in cell wall biosynthesis